jgi:hypothetical protein
MVLTLLLNVVTDFHPTGTIEDILWKEKRKRKDIDTVVQMKDFRTRQQNTEPDTGTQLP